MSIDSSNEIMTPILKHVDDLDVLQEVSFSSTTDTSPERVKSYVPTFESILLDEKLDQSDEQIEHPHFLPPNSDEFLMLPHIRPVVARREKNLTHDACPTPTAGIAELKIM